MRVRLAHLKAHSGTSSLPLLTVPGVLRGTQRGKKPCRQLGNSAPSEWGVASLLPALPWLRTLGSLGFFIFIFFFGFKKFLSGLIQSREVSLSRKLRPRARASEGRDFFLQAASDTGEGEAAFRNSALVPLAPIAVGWMFVSRPPLLLTPGSRCDAVRSLREVAGPQLGPSRMDSCPDNERRESRVLSRQVRSQQCIKQKGAVTRPQARWHPDLKLPASRAVRSKFRWFARRPVCVPRRGRRRRLRTGSGALPCGKPACPDRSFRCLAVGASGTLPPRAQRCRRL